LSLISYGSGSTSPNLKVLTFPVHWIKKFCLKIIFFPQDKASYSKLLAVLHEFRALPVMGCQKTMSDFEKALIAALEEAMPWAEVINFF
jgi:hypothetical protein